MQKHFTFLYFHIAVFAILLLIIFPPAAMSDSQHPVEKSNNNVLIDFRTNSLVQNERVFIGDIAIVHAEKALKEKIKKIKLIPSPGPGEERVVAGKRITAIVRSIRWIPDNTKINIPEFIWVKRSFQTVPEKKLKNLFCGYIEKNIYNIDYKLSKFKIKGKKNYITGDMKLMIREPVSIGSMTGLITLHVIVLIDEKENGKISLSGWVDRYEPVICATRFLPKNTVLDESHLQKKRINISKAPDNIVKNFDAAVKKCLKQTLRPGEYLRTNMLEQPTLIKRGDMIKIIARSGLLTVVAYGAAKTDGARGEQIKVKNTYTNRIVMGRVRDASSVEVIF